MRCIGQEFRMQWIYVRTGDCNALVTFLECGDSIDFFVKPESKSSSPLFPVFFYFLFFPRYGQPTEWTHSHIIGKNEVNRGIQRSEFRQRRERLAERLLKQQPGEGSHLLIIPAARKQFMIEKIPYFFRYKPARLILLQTLSYTEGMNQ